MTRPCYYNDAELKALGPGSERDYLVFVRGADDPSKEMADLRGQIESLNTAVVLSFKRDAGEKRRMLEHLEMIARNTMCGTDWDTALCRAQLDLFVKILIANANGVRSRFIWRIGFHCLVLGIVGIGLMLALELFLSARTGSTASLYRGFLGDMFGPHWTDMARSFLFATLGVAIAIILSAIMRLRSIKIELLGRFDPYVFSPTERIGYTLLIVVTVMLLLGFEIVTIGIGPIILNRFMTVPWCGILIGLLAGFSEPLLAGIIETSLVPKPKVPEPLETGRAMAPAGST